jgi:S1-C subfamily serine protease
VALLRDDGPDDGAPDDDGTAADAPDDSAPEDGASEDERPAVGRSEGGTLTEGAQTKGADRPGASRALEIKVPVEPKGSAYLGIKMEDGPSGGVLVKDLVAGGAAEAAGVKVGDVILLFRGQRVGKVEDLAKLVGEAAPGDDALVVVMRDGKPVRIVALLGSRGSSEAGSR